MNIYYDHFFRNNPTYIEKRMAPIFIDKLESKMFQIWTSLKYSSAI